jgi:hypothetical protein
MISHRFVGPPSPLALNYVACYLFLLAWVPVPTSSYGPRGKHLSITSTCLRKCPLPTSSYSHCFISTCVTFRSNEVFSPNMNSYESYVCFVKGAGWGANLGKTYVVRMISHRFVGTSLALNYVAWYQFLWAWVTPYTDYGTQHGHACHRQSEFGSTLSLFSLNNIHKFLQRVHTMPRMRRYVHTLCRNQYNIFRGDGVRCPALHRGWCDDIS